jgi:hypothetical protein
MQAGGTRKTIEGEGLSRASTAARANNVRRETVSASHLSVGLQ